MKREKLFHIIKYGIFSGLVTGFLYIILSSIYFYLTIRGNFDLVPNILYLLISHVTPALIIFTVMSIILTFLLNLIPLPKAAFILISLVLCIILIGPIILDNSIPELIGEDKINRKINGVVFFDLPSFLCLVWAFFTSNYIYKNFKNA
jgi:hypothetical protein